MADAPVLLRRRRAAPAGIGSLPGVELVADVPTTPEDVATYQRAASSAHVLATHAEASLKVYGIAASLLFSVGSSVALSAETGGYRTLGAAMAGIGGGFGAAALHHYVVRKNASQVRDGAVRGLLAAGQPVPSGVPTQVIA